MRKRLLLVAACLAMVANSALAVELQSIDRSIAKEPDYRLQKQHYGLLVFGRKAETRLWLVRDGDTMYIDRNGNGDLTEPGEAVHSDSNTFRLGEINEADGRTVHTRASVTVYDDGRLKMSLNLQDGCRQTIGYGDSDYEHPHLARRAADAPVLHFNGPMTFARYGPVSLLPRQVEGHSFRKTWLRLFVGSPGLGAGTFTGYNCRALRCEGGYRDIVADIEFPSREPRSQPLKLRQYLKVRG